MCSLVPSLLEELFIKEIEPWQIFISDVSTLNLFCFIYLAAKKSDHVVTLFNSIRKFPVRISTWTLSIHTKGFRGLTQFFQTNAEIVP